MIKKFNTNNRIRLETIQIILGILIILFPLLSPADTIFLENGMRLDVEKAWEEDDEIKYEMYGSVYSYPKDDVSRIKIGEKIKQISSPVKEKVEETREEFAIPQPVDFSEEGGNYLSSIFQAQISEVPKIAWLVPPDIIITDTKFSSVNLYSDSNSILEGKYFRPLNKAEINKIRKTHIVACDVAATYHQYKLTEKQTQRFDFPDRVFYTSKAFPFPVKVGYKFGELGKKGLTNSIKLAELKKSNFLHKYFIVFPVDSEYRYSFHGFYSEETKELFRKGIILHNAKEILAGKFWDINEQTLCDGCPMPLYENEYPDQSSPDMTLLFILLNVFSFPDLFCPVLMLDTSTVEGRALSFITFTDRRKYNEYRLYEYIVNCF